jgi:ribosomal protein S18 acetylase RimI-like enzyme
VPDTRIVDVERAAATHWRGTEEQRLGDWLLRAAGGFTGRANSALALGDPGLPFDEALAAVTGWYRARGLPPMVAVPMPLDAPSELDNHFSERSWLTRPGPAYVMTADLARVRAPTELPAGLELRAAGEPDGEWLRMHRYRGQSDLPPVRLKVLMSADRQAFVSVRSREGGEAVAVGRLSFGGGWAGITSVEVDTAHRRRGLGTVITLAICAQARARGADKILLQVETGNDPARSLYERCGFTYSHRYHYRLQPA